MDRVMHLTIYLTDMADRAAFNDVYTRFFAKPWPVRAAVGVAALAVEGMRVEVTAMAAKA
jgi:enamine deaminase RidA (YjgF/YER057c/UK114 family)